MIKTIVLGFSLIVGPIKESENYFDYFKSKVISLTKWPDIAFAQARIESGNFKSKVFKKCNNAFGMKLNSRKLHSGLTKNKTCKYKDVHTSILDYSLFQERFNSREHFISYIKKKYCSNKKYWKIISSILKDSDLPKYKLEEIKRDTTICLDSTTFYN